MTTQPTTEDAPTTVCWCCGEARREEQLVRLQCHDEVALCDICVTWLTDQARARRGGVLHRAVPILVTSDLTRALQHYRRMGFATEAYEHGGYGFVVRDGSELHVAELERLDPSSNVCSVYLHVGDADALHAEWVDAAAGQLTAPMDTEYGLREGVHVDADGNTVRFGSPIASPGGDDMVIIGSGQPVAVAVGEAIRTGDVESLQELLAQNPGLAAAQIGDHTMSRTLLHAATDWPGHYPNGAATVSVLVQAGADVNARFVGSHTETPLHWAASSDDVEVLDALIDGGADLEAPGAVLGGGSPLADAVGFGQWRVARRLVERGAKTRLKDAAALGLVDRVEQAFAADPPPSPNEVTDALWSACHGGRRSSAELLLDRGADIDWIGWDGLTPLDVARQSEAQELAEWLVARGAHTAAELA